MRRLLAAVALAGAALAPVPAHAAYSRTCGGILDTECHGTVCPMDCFPRDCLVWIDLLHSPFTAQCVSPIVPSS